MAQPVSGSRQPMLLSSTSEDKKRSLPPGGTGSRRFAFERTAASTAVCSMAAAGTSQFLHHPLYTLKTHLQSKRHLSLREIAQKSIRKPIGFVYRGVWPRVFGCMPEKMLKMQAWTATSQLLDGRFDMTNNRSALMSWAIAGCAAGAATTVLGCPAELLMVQAMTRKVSVVGFFRELGLRGVYMGVSATLMRDIVFNCIFLTGRQGFLRYWSQHTGEPPSKLATYGCGLAAGVLAASTACPLDVVKTRMQEKSQAASKNAVQILFKIARTEGVRGLFHGVGPRCVAVSSMMSTFTLLQEKFELFFFGSTVLTH